MRQEFIENDPFIEQLEELHASCLIEVPNKCLQSIPEDGREKHEELSTKKPTAGNDRSDLAHATQLIKVYRMGLKKTTK